MLSALGQRGPDSAGVALFSSHNTDWLIVRATLADGLTETTGEQIAERVNTIAPVVESTVQGGYCRLVVDYQGDPTVIEKAVDGQGEGTEVVSMGKSLEVIKQVGSPENLDATYGIAYVTGTHGIGHTRLATESRVDLSHSQPFWAHGVPDLAIVHNGHITNYHKLRHCYEQKGVRFYTGNDSEIIGVYLAARLFQGMSLAEAMTASVKDFDGSFSYLAATEHAFGFAKDPFAFKPLLFAETDEFVAVATEEVALRAAFPGVYDVREAQAKEVRVWQR